MLAENQTFTNKRISLDGGTFYNCHFDGCELLYAGVLPVGFQRCRFDSCQFLWGGPAMNTLDFIQMIRQAKGLEGTVDQLLDAIRLGTFGR